MENQPHLKNYESPLPNDQPFQVWFICFSRFEKDKNVNSLQMDDDE